MPRAEHPKIFVEKADEMSPGKPYADMSDAERAAQNTDVIYAHSDEEWSETDLPGRFLGEPVVEGMHQSLPCRALPQAEVPISSPISSPREPHGSGPHDRDRS